MCAPARLICKREAAWTLTGSVQVGGTLLLSASTGAINGGITINGGTLRSAISGTLANSINFGNYSPSTIAVATGQTLTLTAGFEPFYFYQQVVFGSATDAGTIVITPSSFTGTIYGPPAGSMEIAGGTVMAGNSFLGAFDAAVTTVDAGATLNFNDQQPTSGDLIYNLQGAGNVVTGTSSAIVLQLAQGNFSGTISGGGNLIVKPVCLPNPYSGGTWCSTGVVVLSGNNTYTGSTTVTSGTLRVTGSDCRVERRYRQRRQRTRRNGNGSDDENPGRRNDSARRRNDACVGRIDDRERRDLCRRRFCKRGRRYRRQRCSQRRRLAYNLRVVAAGRRSEVHDPVGQ